MTDGFANADICAAAAKIAAHPFAQFLIGELDVLGCDVACDRAGQMILELMDHADSRAYLAGRTVSALEAIVFDERSLQRMEFAVAGKTFDCSYLAALVLDCEREARQNSVAVAQNGASAARALVTSFFRTSEVQILTQRVEKRNARLDVERVRLPVDPQGGGDGSGR